MPDYLNPAPPPVDPDAISQATFDRIRQDFPNYDPHEPQLATVIITALALRAAEIADLVPLIPKSIFRWFGANVINFPPDEGSPATLSLTVFVRDNLGYTVEADTTLSVEGDDGVSHLFALDADVIIPAGSTSSGPVTATALEDGAAANGISGATITLVEALDYVVAVEQLGTSSGGTDAEGDDEYLNRLTRRMGLPIRPVLAADFASLSLVEFPEIYRMAALDHYTPGTNEKQTVSSNAIAGNAVWTVAGIATPAIGFNATAATVQGAIESVLGVGAVKVTGGPLPAAVTIEFTGAKGEQDIASIVVQAGWTTTGGAAATATVTTIQPGVAPDPANAGVVTVAGIDSSGEALSASLKAQVDAFLQANREWGFVVNVTDPTFSSIDATFTFTTRTGYDSEDVRQRSVSALTTYVSPLIFSSVPNDSRAWAIQNKVYLWEIVGILEAIEGLDRLVTLTLGRDGGAQGSEDVTLVGSIPITRPGTIVGTPV